MALPLWPLQCYYILSTFYIAWTSSGIFRRLIGSHDSPIFFMMMVLPLGIFVQLLQYVPREVFELAFEACIGVSQVCSILLSTAVVVVDSTLDSGRL